MAHVDLGPSLEVSLEGGTLLSEASPSPSPASRPPSLALPAPSPSPPLSPPTVSPPARAPSPPRSPHPVVDVASLAASLAATADVPPPSRAALAALYALGATTLARHGFSRAALEEALTLLRGVIDEDMRSWGRGAAASFAAFQDAMLASSVERPPRSRGVFSPPQAAAAVHFALSSYYAHFHLYKTLRPPPRLELEARTPSDVPPVLRAPPLATAIQLA